MAIIFATAASAMSPGAPSVAQTYPPVVQRELNRLLDGCRSAGGKPEVQPNAITRAALRDGEFNDFIIWSGNIHCDGAMTVFGGTAGQALVLIPADGKGVRQVLAHSWRLVGDGPMSVEVIGGFDCAMGRVDRCTAQLTWNGSAFASQTHQAKAMPASADGRPRSIVGDWAESRAACGSPAAGMVRIGPMSIANDEFSCRFDRVSRSGATVEWMGSCEEGLGPRAGKAERQRVTATEAGGRLTIRFADGHQWPPMIRCPR